MGKPKAPKAPDPKVTAAAQTGTNVSTALANAALQNVNQVTPDGSLTFSTNGYETFKDPTSGTSYQIPRYLATQSLSPAQQAIKNESDRAEKNLATLAADQSGRIGELIGNPMTLGGLPSGGDASSLAPPQYQQYQGGPQLQSQLGNTGSVATSFGDAGAITKSYGTDFSADRQKVEDALLARLNPQLGRDRDALQTQLSNQGIKLGSTAYDRALEESGRNSNDARLGAILAGGQEQSRLVGLEAQRAGFENSAQQQGFTQGLTRAQFGNQGQQQAFEQDLAGKSFTNTAMQQEYQNAQGATQGNNQLADRTYQSQIDKLNAQNAQRSQALQEQFSLRNQPINEITALLSGSQVSQPNFVGTNQPTIPTVDYAGLVQQDYQNKLGVYNQQSAQSSGLFGGVLGLGAGLLQFSDKRLKTDIEKVGKTDNGQPIYSYRYKAGGPMRLGLMAQDVEKKKPEAVVTTPSGYKAVDYGKALSLGGGL